MIVSAFFSKQSLNGVFIDGKKLESNKEHTLKDGEKLQIGVALKTGQSPPYVWVYKAKLKVKKIKKPVATDIGSEHYQVSSQKSISEDVHEKGDNEDGGKGGQSTRKRSRSPVDPCMPSTSG